MANNFNKMLEISFYPKRNSKHINDAPNLWINLCITRITLTFIFVLLLRIDLGAGISSGNCTASQFQCNDGECIQKGWECDGEPDCSDLSDEDTIHCGNRTCGPDHFSCGKDLPCIPISWKCDSNEDCGNGLDEVNCTQTCKEDEFQCNDTLRCITNTWKCDHDKDCTDGSDELNCVLATCSPDQFLCTNGRCIPPTWRCDGDNDCTDRSDEQNCTKTTVPGSLQKQCHDHDFQCTTSRECINQAWKCDRDKDCQDGSDEEGCVNTTCTTDQFQCHNGSCIDGSKQCDGHNDCYDASDEIYCLIKCNAATEFDCSGGNGSFCIPLIKACNRRADCPSGADEDPNYCSRFSSMQAPNNLCIDKGNCSDHCYNISGVIQCRCKPGYQLAENNKTCEDIDECEVYIGICSQACNNTIGSYKCECHEGYVKDYKQKCKAAGGEEPRLLFANRHDLREFGLHTGHYQSVVAERLHSAIALDYDYNEKLIYWSDVASESITRRLIDAGTDAEHQTLVKSDISTPDGLALDWIHKNLYWTDTGNNRIEVISVGNINSTWRMVLVNERLDEPRAIVVDPRKEQRYMYWTDWGDTPKIEKSNLDGSNRTILLGSENNQSPGLVWPNGLAIDYDSDRLFWVDAKLHLIGSSDLEGRRTQTVFTSFLYLKHPFALTVFEDDIYWSDWEAESILKVSKHNGNRNNNHTVMHIADRLYSPMDVHVYHALKQPIAENACENALCDHLCFPIRSAPYYRCHCSHYGGIFKLGSDNKTCMDITPPSTPITSPLPATSAKTASPGSISDPQLLPPSSVGIEGPEGVSSTLTPSSSGRADVMSVFIGLTVVLFVAALIIAIVYCRYFRIRTPKGLNFDNPVYRRTTEDDQFCIERSDSCRTDRSTYLQPKALSSLLQPLNTERM